MRKKNTSLLLVFLLVLLLSLQGCNTGSAKKQKGDQYRAVSGFGEGFVAVGNGGIAARIDLDGAVTELDLDTDENLLCVTQWQNGLMIGGASGLLLRIEQDFTVTRKKLGSSDLVSFAMFRDKLYAISRNGRLFESEDGEVWRAEKTGLGGVVGMAASEECLLAATKNPTCLS